MNKLKKPSRVFEVLFEGRGVLPEAIPLGTLTQALSAIRRLAAGDNTSEDDGEDENSDAEVLEDETKNGSIRLLNVKRGSAIYQFVCPKDDDALLLLKQAGRVLKDPEKIGNNDYILNPIRKLSQTARSIGCNIILRESGKANGILATIGSESYEKISSSIFIEGDTSFVGNVVRTGGATSIRCALRVSFQQKLLYCSVSNADISRKLGEYLYQDVVASGQAKWIKGSWKILEFRVNNVSKLEKGKLIDVLDELREIGGSDWDNIDNPREYIEEVCGV